MRQRRNLSLNLRGFRIFSLVLWNIQDGRVLWKISVPRSIEERQRLVILGVADGIVRVGVALHAVHGEAIQYRPSGG